VNRDSSSCAPGAHPNIEDTAIAWLTERDDGFSPAREREFARWLRADPRHAATVTRLEQTLGLLGELPQHRAELNTEFNRAAPVVPFPLDATLGRTRRLRGWTRLFAWGGLAAALVCSVSVGWWTLRSPEEIRYTTPTADNERVRLEDGSTLELNVASVARVQFNPTERRVELEAGEALFAVTPDATRPFVVHAGGVSVRAVGTAFNVRLAAGEVEVIVVEGRVSVARGGAEGAVAESASLVGAGERAVVSRQVPPPPVEKLAPAVLRQALAWQGRLVDFSDAPLAAVVARFNARNPLQLVLADAELGARRVGGTFALDEVEAFVRLLERDGTVLVERRGAVEIVLRRAR